MFDKDKLYNSHMLLGDSFSGWLKVDRRLNNDRYAWFWHDTQHRFLEQVWGRYWLQKKKV